MPAYPERSIRQPQPFDIVEDPVETCGIGTGFEGPFAARVRDGNEAELARITSAAGGTGTWANFHATPLPTLLSPHLAALG